MKILQYNLISLTRLRVAKYQFAPEYIALLFIIVFFSMVLIGVYSETPIKVNDGYILNFNKVAVFYLIAPIFIDAFGYKFYDPNYHYFKLLYPYKLSKIIFIDFMIELFNYKILFILSFVLMYVPFCIAYNLDVFGFIPTLGFVLITLNYINSNLIIRLIKDVMKDKAYSFHKNYLKLFVVIFFILYMVNINIDFIDMNSSKIIFWFVGLSILMILTFIVLLYLINHKYDKI